MDYRQLGNSGLKISTLSCGTYEFRDEKKANETVHSAFDQGINFFDTSCSYGEKGEVEILTGNALRKLPRDEFILATKVRWGYGCKGINNRGLSRKHIYHSLHSSLKRLKMDFIDLYQLHGSVPDCPLEETLTTIEGFIQQGKILYWGLSDFDTDSTSKVLEICDRLSITRPISHQPEYSLLNPGLVDSRGPLLGLDKLSEKYGFGIIPYSPLAGGMLTGKYQYSIPTGSRIAGNLWERWDKKVLTNENLTFVSAIEPIAKSLNIELSQLALAWVLNKSFISSAIIGYTKASQLNENVKSIHISLDSDTLNKIDELREHLIF